MIVEETTPKGYVLKINLKKLTFIAFDRLGGTVYAGPHGESTIHKIPVICFMGKRFILKEMMINSYHLVKVSRNKLLLPYYIAGNKDRHYHLIDTEESMDMIPVKIIKTESVLDFIQLVEDGAKPDFIFIEADMQENDIIVFRNRYTKGTLVRVDTSTETLVTQEKEERETKNNYTVNLNTMSTNPVFLASIHLRNFKLSSVKQVLLDFELSDEDAMYITSYLEIMKKKGKYPNPYKNESKLDEMIADFKFYRALINKNTDVIKEMIDEIDNLSVLSAYMTILAKAQSVVSEDAPSDLDFVDYENLLYDKKEQLNAEKAAAENTGG